MPADEVPKTSSTNTQQFSSELTPSCDTTAQPSDVIAQLSLRSPSVIPATIEIPRSTPGPPRKRARPTISCLECRRKKLKCDRKSPCNQCVRIRRENLCTFATDFANASVNRALPQPLAPATQDEGDRVSKRMRYEGTMTPNLSPESDQPGEANSASVGSSFGRIYVKGNTSRFLGIGNRMAMLDRFEDVKNYIMECFKYPGTVSLMYELTGYQRLLKPKLAFQKPESSLPYERTALVLEMLKWIPADGSLTAAFRSYKSHWEGFLRVLHIPSFSEEVGLVEKFLQLQSTSGSCAIPHNIREDIIPQMVGVCILSARMDQSENNDLAGNEIARMIVMMQRWSDGLKDKERLNIESLRVQILLLLSKMKNLDQIPNLWKESGNLVRSAMILGLHQDSEFYATISPFEKEQRRKLWRTVLELDLQFSLASGMPTAVQSFKSRSLKNVDDSALQNSMPLYPDHKAAGSWTDASPQIIMGASLEERLITANVLGDIFSSHRDIEKLLLAAQYFDHELQRMSSDLSKKDISSGKDSERSPGKLFKTIMMDVQLRRSALCAYQHIMLSKYCNHYQEARKGALHHAIAILSHLDALDPEIADPNTIKNRDQLKLFHVLCKKDIIQSALLICHEIQSFGTSSQVSRQNPSRLGRHDDSFPWTKASLTRIVENTLKSLLQGIGNFGSDLKDILPLSIVLQSARSDGTSEDKKALMRKGAERVLKACRTALPISATSPAPTNNNKAPSSNAQKIHCQHPPPDYYNSNKYQSSTSFSADKRNSFGDSNMLPGINLSFEDLDFDFGMADWDLNESWL